MTPKLCLNMIVRNESARIIRCLESVAPYIDCYTIIDTGSTDDTIPKILATFSSKQIPGEITHVPFVNFEQARNAALEAARASPYEFDYLLLLDADMELVVEDKAWRDTLTEPAYHVLQKGGTLAYSNKRLIARALTRVYHGLTHEYLDAPGDVPLPGVWFKDYQDGENRKDKFKRDILLLVAALKKDPNNARYHFYLANSYRDAGNYTGAIAAYKKRIKLGGWDQETWNAQYKMALCYKALGQEAEFIRNMLIAYNQRPSPPNFSNNARASTSANMASPTTAAAGTAQMSERSLKAARASLVATSTEARGRESVEIGFITARTRTGAPWVIPPRGRRTGWCGGDTP